VTAIGGLGQSGAILRCPAAPAQRRATNAAERRPAGVGGDESGFGREVKITRPEAAVIALRAR